MRLIIAIIITMLFVCGCVEGPAGPPGKDGSNNGIKDSIVIDIRIMAEFYYKRFGNKIEIDTFSNDTTVNSYELSASERNRFNSYDTSIFSIDNKWGGVLAKAKFEPNNWYGRLEPRYVHGTSQTDSSNWIVRVSEYRSSTQIKENIYILPSIVDTIEYISVGEFDLRYFPGKGFNVTSFADRNSIYDGIFKIYYW
jgi:hypothetical protein